MEFIRVSCFALVALCAAVGCQPAQPTSTASTNSHEHEDAHEHGQAEAKSYAEGIEMLGKVSEEIKAANENGKPEDAHDALHEIGELLEVLPALAEQQPDLEATAKEDIKKNVKSLFESYTKLDDAMHDGEQVDYSTLAPAIQAAIDALKGYVK